MSYAGQIETGDGSISPIGSTLYGVCSTAGGTAAKVVGLTDFDTLIIGATVHVKFVNGNTAANPTLDINNSGSNIPIYTHGTSYPGNTAATSWAANSVVSFTYDGTAWRMNDVGANAAIIKLLEDEVDAEEAAREADTEMLLSRIAPDYDSTATYRKNQLVIYNQNLYRCNNDITVAEAWTAAHWTATTVAAEREYKLVETNTEIGVASTATADIGESTGITAATVDVSVYETILSTSAVFEYNVTEWNIRDGTSNVNLNSYGITITGDPVTGDTITITYDAGTAPFKKTNTYTEYPFCSKVPIANLQQTMVAEVIFGLEDAISGMFAPIAESHTGEVWIFATQVPPEPITIPTMIFWG